MKATLHPKINVDQKKRTRQISWNVIADGLKCRHSSIKFDRSGLLKYRTC